MVAVDHTGEDISALLTNAATKVVSDTTRADFDAALSLALEATATAG